MKIKATKQIIDWDGESRQMLVLNVDDVATLSDAMRAKHEGSWEPAGDEDETPTDLRQLDHDGDGAPGGSEPHQPPSLTGKNKAELLAIAEAEGVDANAEMTNKAIAEAIEAAREAGDEDEAPAA